MKRGESSMGRTSEDDSEVVASRTASDANVAEVAEEDRRGLQEGLELPKVSDLMSDAIGSRIRRSRLCVDRLLLLLLDDSSAVVALMRAREHLGALALPIIHLSRLLVGFFHARHLNALTKVLLRRLGVEAMHHAPLEDLALLVDGQAVAGAAHHLEGVPHQNDVK